jgi:adhesin/invasin
MVTSRHRLTLVRLLCITAAVTPLVTCTEQSTTQPGNEGAIEFQIVISSPALPTTAPVGSTLPPLQVKVLNKRNGQTLFNEPVNFVVIAGGGSVFAPTVATDNASGIALDLWTLGTRAGFDTLQARVVDTSRVGPLAGSTSIVTFAVQATPLAAAVIGTQAGNGQTAIAGSTLPLSPTVLVTDRFGNPVGGVSVSFAVGSGGGSVTGTPQSTSANGLATVGGWTLGTTAGPNTLTATAAGLTGSPVTFAATGISASAMQLIPVTSTAFTGTGVAGTIPAVTGPAVRVVDANNNGVPNASVTFTVTGPGCPSCSVYPGTSPSAPGKIAGVGSITVLTDGTGRASGGNWTLSTLAGANTLQATAVGLAGSPVVFTANGTAGAAALLFKKAGDGQTGSIGTALPIQPAVQVTDVYGNPSASGTAVTFSVQSGGGGVPSAPAVTVTTDLSGTASVSWTLSPLAGANTLTASGVNHTVTFAATGTGPAGLNITNHSGDAQTQPAGTTLPIAPAAQVTDPNGHPVAGVQVVFNVTAGGGSLTGATQVTDATGVATVGGWTLGPAVGVNELKATFSTGVSRGSTIFVGTANCLPPSGLVSWWLGEGNGNDLVGANNGTIQGGVTFSAAEVRQGFVFSNDGDGVTIPDNPTLNAQSPGFSADLWVRGTKNQPENLATVFEKSHGWTDPTGWAFQIGSGVFPNDGRARFFLSDGTFADILSSVDVLDGNFHHLTATWDGSVTRFYVDAVLAGTAFNSTPANNSRAVNIGFTWGGGTPRRFFRGTADELRVFNRALSQSEIQSIVAAGSAGNCHP